MLREVNATCITLVPKKDSPSTLGDYRPIACCSVVYKCITKILTARMRMFMNDVISPNQSAFITGKHIQYNILLSHELFHNYHWGDGLPRWVAMVDLRKACDSMRWEAVEFALYRIGVHMCTNPVVLYHDQWKCLRIFQGEEGNKAGWPHITLLVCTRNGDIWWRVLLGENSNYTTSVMTSR